MERVLDADKGKAPAKTTPAPEAVKKVGPGTTPR